MIKCNKAIYKEEFDIGNDEAKKTSNKVFIAVNSRSDFVNQIRLVKIFLIIFLSIFDHQNKH